MILHTQISPISNLDYNNFVKLESKRFSDYIMKLYNSRKITEAIEIVMDEILGNVIIHEKYPNSVLDYSIIINNDELIIEVVNKVTDDQNKKIQEKIDEINKENKNLEDLYARAMVENDEGGLGLIRLVQELKCNISYYEKEENYISVVIRLDLKY